MDNLNGHVMTLANSIIGVSILAMPYCFKQCGIILSILMLLVSSIISRLACHFLLKSAIIARRKTFEFLAFYIFGGLGKFAIEIGIIGFLLGTCIAFFVVMGDLGPEIIAEVTNTYTSDTMRTSILMALALFVVLPLGLLRNVDSLNGVSRATIGFYCCLVLKVIFEATPHIFSGDWFHSVNFWRPQGILQCLPIFSMALFCQTQLFEIYQAVPNATLEKMDNLVRVAVNICTCVYIFVGVFGYIAFANKNFGGNMLLSFAPSVVTDIMKIGFILSVAFSFPLVIFPCRASLYSLIYKEGYSIHEGVSNYIPEGRFKALTMFIVFLSLIIGIMIPNIELVLGLVGSTIGVMICVLFPVTCFICISPKNTNERLMAQIMLLVGIFVMVLGTYENLYKLDDLEANTVTTSSLKSNQQIDNAIQIVNVDKLPLLLSTIKIVEIKTNEHNKVTENIKEVRHEPPQPVEPIEEYAKEEIKIKKKDDKLIAINSLDSLKNDTRNEQVDIEAIKKEDKEEALQAKEKVKDENTNEVLLDTIQKQQEVQKELVAQQKKILEAIQDHQKKSEEKEVDKLNKERLKAVKEIEIIARKAIEKISGGKETEGSLDRENNNNAIPNEIIKGTEKRHIQTDSKDQVSINLKHAAENKTNKLSTSENKDTEMGNVIQKDTPSQIYITGDQNPKKHVENNDTKIETNPKSLDKSKIYDVRNLNIIPNKQLNTNSSLQANVNNSAPLFLKLGKAEISKPNDTLKLVPLPIVLSKNTHSNYSLENHNQNLQKPLINSLSKNDVLEDNQNKENINLLRRDILELKITQLP